MSVFNLLIKAGGWDESGTDRIDRERLFEYTAQHVMSRFQSSGGIDVSALQRLPTVLMPERWKHFGDDQLAQVVTISALSIHSHEVRLSYIPDGNIPRIPNDVVVNELSAEWGLGRFETTRTHWAVKDVDLYRSLVPVMHHLNAREEHKQSSKGASSSDLILIGAVDDASRVLTGSSPNRGSELPLEHLRDPESIEEHLARIDPNDPPQAISSSKSLLESTIKHVLEELDVPYRNKDDIPALTRLVHKSLEIHPESVAPTAKGRNTILRILSNLSQISVGVAELRNEYGMDHGRTRPSRGLGFRHAELAFGAAQTYCRFLLETLADRRAMIEQE